MSKRGSARINSAEGGREGALLPRRPAGHGGPQPRHVLCLFLMRAHALVKKKGLQDKREMVLWPSKTLMAS